MIRIKLSLIFERSVFRQSNLDSYSLQDFSIVATHTKVLHVIVCYVALLRKALTTRVLILVQTRLVREKQTCLSSSLQNECIENDLHLNHCTYRINLRRLIFILNLTSNR